MSAIIVWGKCRDLLSGELPAGVSVTEVATLEELQAKLDPAVATLVLADCVRLDAERSAIEEWMKAGGRDRIVLLCATDAEGGDDVLERSPFVDDAFVKPISPARLRHRVLRELDLITERRALQQLEAAFSQKSHELQALNRVGIALSAERDIEKLLELILRKSREITGADAGSLYLVEKPEPDSSQTMLHFKLAQNDSIQVPFEKQKFPLSSKEPSIAGYAALNGKVVHVVDAYNLPAGSPFEIGRKFDEKSGYRTKSILVVPMRDHEDNVIGVVQLINKKRDPRQVLRPMTLVDQLVIPFTSLDEELLTTLASQAAIAYENTRLLQDIKNLFDSFVNASVTAIESRDPTTSGHSARVATLTVAIAEKVDGVEAGPFKDIRFNYDQLQEIKYASLLHDFGKVGVREKVLIKGKKLYVGELLLLRARFAYVKRAIEAEYLRAKLEQLSSGRASGDLVAEMDREHDARQREVDAVLRMIVQANEPTILEEDNFRTLMDLPKRTYSDIDGNRQPYLTPNELSALSIRRGSLSEKERREIESHVTHTYRFLSQIPWTGEFRNVPQIAYAHHEKLDGTGYPRRLAGVDIPIQSRMMTISDIYDALVAWDRPYKKSVPVERALDILKEEAGQGKLDTDLLALFIEAKIYDRTPKAGAGAEIARP
jgi:HD-GYP domain-containing protein (c-di-GMP phosphodiesterase class II)